MGPARAWPNERRWIWLTIAGWVFMLRRAGVCREPPSQTSQGTYSGFFPGIRFGPELD